MDNKNLEGSPISSTENKVAQSTDNKKDLAFDKTNFIMLAIGMAIVILGFLLMSGGNSNEKVFDPEIFSTMRIKVAPVICFIGFVSMIFAIIHKPKNN